MAYEQNKHYEKDDKLLSASVDFTFFRRYCEGNRQAQLQQRAYFFLTMLCTAIFCIVVSVGARAEVYGPPLALTDPLVVEFVDVDVTADNAVKARDQAIIEAQRKALMILASRFMSAEDLQSFTPPNDNKISRLVKDFEILREQIAAQRYVGLFKVRFSKSVSSIIPIPPPQASETVAIIDRDIPWDDRPWDEVESSAKTILVLPYLEQSDGRTLLWEDNNDWLKAWQDHAPAAPVSGRTWIVPLGDIGDMSAGEAEAVWSGDYRAVEKLRLNYHADEVILAVANLQGSEASVDLYAYRDIRLSRRQAVKAPIIEDNRAQALLAAMQSVLQGPSQNAAKPVIAVPDLYIQKQTEPNQKPSGDLSIIADLAFKSESEWVAVQRALRQVTPPIKSHMESMTRTSARFIITFAGSEEQLRTALMQQNIILGTPNFDLDRPPGQFGVQSMQAVYDLKMVRNDPVQ